MRSNRVAWSTFTNSVSQVLRSSSAALLLRSSPFGVSTCFLQYSITFARILLVTFGNGIPLSAQSSSTMCLIVCDSSATASSTSNDSPSELLSVIFLGEDIVSNLITFRSKRETKKHPQHRSLSSLCLKEKSTFCGEKGKICGLFIEGITLLGRE